jgi:hypothetical protein
MKPVEISYWLDRASEDQRARVRTAGEEAQRRWLAQRLHPLDVLVAIEAATVVEIIAQRGLRTLGRA